MNPAAAQALFEDAVRRLDNRMLDGYGWIVHAAAYPTLDVSFRGPEHDELRLQFSFDDWNDSPPAVQLQDSDGRPLSTLPSPRSAPSSIFNASSHPKTSLPFICMIGVREYHTHPSHVGDSWSAYKDLDAYSLGGIVIQVWRGWQRFWP